MNSPRILLLLGLITLSGLGACTQSEQRNNTHSETPQIEQNSSPSHSSSIEEGITLMQRSRGSRLEAIKSFYESHLTENFFLKAAEDNNSNDLKILTDFHLHFLKAFSDSPDDRESLSDIALKYYNRILSLCDGNLNNCEVLSIFKDTVYAADMLLTAENKVPENEKDQFIYFLTQIGRPHNNIHILQKKLTYLMSQLDKQTVKDAELIQRISNLVVFISTKTSEVQMAPIEKLYELMKSNRGDIGIKKSFEKLLRLALEKKNSPQADKIVKDYCHSVLKNSDFLEALKLRRGKGLIQWKGQLQTFSLQDDWPLLFIAQGFLQTQLGGELHDHLFRTYLEENEDSTDLLELAKAYIYKKFVLNAYKSHKMVGQIFTEEYEKYGKVDAMFGSFFTKSDTVLAEIWNNSYKRQVSDLVTGITPYFTSSELKELNQISDQLEANIRNVVAYPTQFIAGYFASRQGNFNYKIPIRDGRTLELNDSYWFKEHFDGVAPVFFSFVTESEIKGQEAMMSFLVSLDKTILSSYGLNLEFVDDFFKTYLSKERQFLVEKNQGLQQKFEANSLPSEMLGRCEKMKKGDFNFTYELSFLFADHMFFKGQAYQLTGRSSPAGTSWDMYQLFDVFNNQKLEESLSEDMEVLRMELGPKLNRMRVLQRALEIQGENELAKSISESISKIDKVADTYMSDVETMFKKTVDCYFLHDRIETRMRKAFFKHEISFVKNTFHALRVLNSKKDDVPSIEELRKTSPDIFQLEYFQDLPDKGDLIHALNQRWLKVGAPFRNQISNYDSQVSTQIGFNKTTTGRYAYFTNKFETRFRKLGFMLEDSRVGKEFPISVVNSVPRDFEELNASFGKNGSHFFNLNLSTNETEKQFAFNYFEKTQRLSNGHATNYRMSSDFVIKIALLNWANFAKTKAYRLFSSNFDYSNYKEEIAKQLNSNYEYLSQLTDDILRDLNIDSETEEILRLMQEDSFLRSDGRVPGHSIFVYYPGINFLNIGQYDVFFNTLVSYQLGKYPDFRAGLFGSGPQHLTGKDMNPVILDWIPETDGNFENAKVIVADDVNGRRSVRRFTKDNGAIAKYFDQEVLFEIDPHAKALIRHDLFHTLAVDYSLADSFIEWTTGRELSHEKVPYHLDLVHHSPPVNNPPLVYPSLIERYYDNRNQYDYESLNVIPDVLKKQSSTN